MARRKKRFGAVTGRKPGQRIRIMKFGLGVQVTRYHDGYAAWVCPKTQRTRGSRRVSPDNYGRCGHGEGKNATKAVANALRSMATKLK